MLSKNNVTRPFEDRSSVEFLGRANDCSLFAFGSHSKKRPNNIVSVSDDVSVGGTRSSVLLASRHSDLGVACACWGLVAVVVVVVMIVVVVVIMRQSPLLP
jgi:hypothetical protein